MRSLAALLLAVLLLSPPPADAQGLRMLSAGEGPLEVEADEAIELRQQERLVIARGNARARQGGVVLDAQVLAASFRDTAEGRQEIHRLDAVGDVLIRTERETIRGDNAVYDLDQDVVQITGDALRIETPEQTITARDSLEYWNREQRAVARGDAVAAQADQRLRADVLEALLEDQEQDRPAGGDERASIRLIRAWGNVLISTATEIVQGERGEYDVRSGVATLSGSVKITRGENQLDGERAVVNMRTGVSRLVAGDATGRVRGLFVPESESEPPRPPDAGRR